MLYVVLCVHENVMCAAILRESNPQLRIAKKQWVCVRAKKN